MGNGKEEVKDVQVPKEQLDVELVKCRKKPGVTYALKCLKKQHIVETQQQEHVFSEKNILMSCRHNFITRLYKTFKDRKYIYTAEESYTEISNRKICY